MQSRFQAQPHGLFARCLCFAARITPIEHHARLASRWRPTLAGHDSHLRGFFRRFPLCASTHIVSSSSKLSWRTGRRDAVQLIFRAPRHGPRVSSSAKLDASFFGRGYSTENADYTEVFV